MSVKAIPDGPRIIPYLLYRDVAGALDWLARAFGFTEHGQSFKDESGRLSHAEMKLGEAIVMMGCPGDDYRNPADLGATTQMLYVYVENVDAHCEQARAAGAVIEREPADEFYGDRRYSARDPEGHVWYFAQHVRDVSPEEMAAAH